MKIEGPKPPGASRVSRAGAAKASGATQGVAGAREISDTTSILGVPEGDITPKVREAIMGLMEEVSRLREELRRSQGRIQHLEHLADQDSLLPINNRRAFVRELNRAISMGQRYSYPSTVVYFDVDNMKAINDELGHPAGDAALTLITEKLKENVRDSDVIGRLGGDEFGVILLQADEERGQEKAKQLADSIESSPLHFGGEEVQVTVTWGLYTFSGQDDASGALAAADEAMYARKRSRT